MKQFFTFFAAVVLLVGFTPTVLAYDFSAVAPSGQTLYYNIVDGNAEVTFEYVNGYPPYQSTYPTGSLTIPSIVTHNDATYSVTSIGNNAFLYCTELTSVIIPNTVTSIGDDAFFGCIGLTSVTISNSVISIGEYCFYGCTGLTGTLSIPNSVTSIDRYAFEGCTGLTSVTIGNSVTSIGDNAFSGCSGLTGALSIPNSVTSIGNGAFSGCSSITSITIPNSVTSIGYTLLDNNYYTPFSGCSSLSSIVVESGNTVYDSRNSCNAIIETATDILIAGCKNTTIPNSVTSIRGHAFSGHTGLTSLTIPNSITAIGDRAFSICTGITEIHSLCNVAPTLDNNAFNGVTSTIPVYIPCGASGSYYGRWSYFSNFIESDAATFSAVSADNNMGTVQILTMPTCTNPQAVIYASANSGYRFDHWSDGNTTNPYSLTVTEDTELIGYFVPDGGGSQGIGDMTSADGMKVYTRGNTIMIDFSGQQAAVCNQNIVVCDVMGRVIKQAAGSGQQAAVEIPVTSAGVYMVKVGDTQPQKVVVRR